MNTPPVSYEARPMLERTANGGYADLPSLVIELTKHFIKSSPDFQRIKLPSGYTDRRLFFLRIVVTD